MSKYLILCVSIFLFGCVAPQMRTPTVSSEETRAEIGTQFKLVIDKWLEQNQKLQDISGRIRVANTEICNDFVSPYYGFDVWSLDSMGALNPIQKEVLTSKYQLRHNIKIKNIVANSPADKAGLKFGDEIDEIEGKKIPLDNKEAFKQLDKLLSNDQYKSITLKVWRSRKFVSIKIQPLKACLSEAYVGFNDKTINAFADGKNIFIARGMLNFIDDDDELATVVSHEIAHNAMKHNEAQQQNATIGGVLGLLIDFAAAAYGVNTNGDFSRMGAGIAVQQYSVEFEQEADYVGIYFLKNAGYDISKTANFWRRMGAEHDNLYTETSHPSPPQRFIAIQKTVDEIEKKMMNNQPLVPNIKMSD